VKDVLFAEIKCLLQSHPEVVKELNTLASRLYGYTPLCAADLDPLQGHIARISESILTAGNDAGFCNVRTSPVVAFPYFKRLWILAEELDTEI
jgi:hypothetical protein